MTLKGLEAVLGAVRLGGSTSEEHAAQTTKVARGRKESCMMSTKSRRHPDSATLFYVLLPGLVTLQAALCAAQCSFWHVLLQ